MIDLRRASRLLPCLLLAACATAAPSPPSSAAAAASAPLAAPASPAAVALRQAPADLGCDSVGIDYRSVTFRIDPTAAEYASAVADTGVPLLTYWAAGFQPGTSAERVIRDPAGAVVVTDGEVLSVPQGASPRLHGYFVCLGPTKLYVLLKDPS